MAKEQTPDSQADDQDGGIEDREESSPAATATCGATASCGGTSASAGKPSVRDGVPP
jgi:hypothetical protein